MNEENQKVALTGIGMVGFASSAKGTPSSNCEISTVTKKEHKAWFIKNKTDEMIKAGHSRAFARTLARLAYKNSLRG